MSAAASSAQEARAGRGSAPAFARRSPAAVIGNRALGSLVWLTLEVPEWPGAGPGQFALIQAEGSCCFLGRPLSVAQQGGGTVSFLIARVGAGTRELCGLGPGDHVWVLGPLGRGFDLAALAAGPGRTVIVGGGVGAAPFPLLLAGLGVRGGDHAPQTAGDAEGEVLVLLGFRDAAQAKGAEPVLAAVAALEGRGVHCRTEVVTEDGSLGRAEKVTDTLGRELRPRDRLAVCGPWAMTEAVARMCAEVADVRAWFSLEAGMACGVGSCHGCVIPLGDGSMVRVCREGPVFETQTLFERGRLSAADRGLG